MEINSVNQGSRFKLGALLSRKLIADPTFAALCSASASGSRNVVIPALPEDLISQVTVLVDRAGGTGTVVLCDEIAESVKRFAIFTISRVSESSESHDHHLPMQDMTLKTLLQILRPGASVTFREDGNELMISDLGDGPAAADPQPVLA